MSYNKMYNKGGTVQERVKEMNKYTDQTSVFIAYIKLLLL